MKILLALLPFAAAMYVPAENDILTDKAWVEWKLTHRKFYKDSKEESIRQTIWKMHLQEVLQHNADGKHSYRKGMNHFSDLVSPFLELFSKDPASTCYRISVFHIPIKFFNLNENDIFLLYASTLSFMFSSIRKFIAKLTFTIFHFS